MKCLVLVDQVTKQPVFYTDENGIKCANIVFKEEDVKIVIDIIGNPREEGNEFIEFELTKVAL